MRIDKHRQVSKGDRQLILAYPEVLLSCETRIPERGRSRQDRIKTEEYSGKQ
ncbi:MAG: hypothetical protein WBA57_05250 [Elainellaceae cyanobacterium]